MRPASANAWQIFLRREKAVLQFCPMSLGHSNRPAKAAAILFLTTTFWGTSFLLMKALGQHQHALSPRSGTLLVSSLSLFIRFGLGAVVMLALNFRASKHVTRLEFGQGLGLGVFGGIGIVLQMDVVLYTPASTPAFLTQCYCIFIPVFVACHRRAWPSR